MIPLTTLAEKDKAYIWHPFTPQKANREIIPIVAAKGAWLADEKGNQYLDAISSWWVTLHGHAHPYIAQALYEQAQQLEQVIFAGFTHAPAVQLAERLLALLPPGCSKVFYSDNGSTATEVALKMALQFWWNQGQGQRKKILAFRHSYHGDTFGAMSMSDRNVFTLAFQEKLFEVVFVDPPSKDNLPAAKALVAADPQSFAACIYEPLVQGAGGMRFHDPSALDQWLAFLQSHEILCLADEVMTGFGRTGKTFASDHLTQKPDIICLSKGLTGGTMALGVTACSEKIHAAFTGDDAQKTFFHGHSFTANPLACRCALASLDLLLDPSCQEKIAGIAQFWNHALPGLATFSSVDNPRALGTILALEIKQGENQYLNPIATEITRMALAEGVYLRPLGNTLYAMPPYCITHAELCRILEVIHKVVQNFCL